MIGFSLKTRNLGLKTLLLLSLILLFGHGAQAAEVGRFTQVEGQVELLKAGQAPAVPATVQAPVEEKDVIKTGPESRAQLRFLDDTTLSVAPLSQITVEAYMYDAQQGKRQSRIKVAQGLVQAVVSKIFKAPEPDFLIKTQTAVMGVRGTEFYVLVVENAESPGASGSVPDLSKAPPAGGPEGQPTPVSTDVFVKSGRVEMSSSNPAIKGTVLLGPLQSTRIAFNRPPGPRLALAPKDFLRLRSSMVTGVSRAVTGHTRNPRELLQRLPVRPPRPLPPPRPGGAGGVKPRREGKPLLPAARPPAAQVKPPKAKERPVTSPRMRPQKPGEKPPVAADRMAPSKEPKRLTRPEALRKEAPRAAPLKTHRERQQAVPGAPRKREPAQEPAAKPQPPGTTPSPPPGPQEK